MTSNNRIKAKDPTRREALLRLGFAVAAAYVVPEVVNISQARASSSASPPSAASKASSPPSDPSSPSAPSSATPPTPPTAPSDVEDTEVDVQDTDTCTASRSAASGNATISRSDFERAQAAVDAGYAKPLDVIWADFNKSYSGKVIGVEFTGHQWRPRYRFRAISASGHLETVIVSARTGKIERIVGC